MRLVILDAGSFDFASKKGGISGAVITRCAMRDIIRSTSSPEEICHTEPQFPSLTSHPALPSGAALPAWVKPTVERLKKTKAAIDSGDKDGNGPISWSDLLFLAAKTTSQVAWKKSKV